MKSGNSVIGTILSTISSISNNMLHRLNCAKARLAESADEYGLASSRETPLLFCTSIYSGVEAEV